MSRNLSTYLRDILECCDRIQRFLKGLDLSDFTHGEKTQYAVMLAIQRIGEAVKQVPESFRLKHPFIPWKRIAGMRNYIVQAYFGIDISLIWATATNEIPILRTQIADMLSQSTKDL